MDRQPARDRPQMILAAAAAGYCAAASFHNPNQQGW